MTASTADRARQRLVPGLEMPDPKRAMKITLTMGGTYSARGLTPLVPYVLLGALSVAFRVALPVMLLALIIVGFGKACFTGAAPLRSVFQTRVVGRLAAAASLIARAIG